VKSITLVAYNRPLYTDEVLRALASCRLISDFDRLAIFVDPGCADVAGLCRTWSKRMPIAAEVFANESRLGVAGNPLKAYSYVFEQLAVDYNVAIEDDAVLSPDALELALWFHDHHGSETSRYCFFNLCDHYRYRGEGRNWGNVPEDPSLIAENADLSSPFAWCLPRREWPFVKRNWNQNTRSIGGWDWSIRFAMRMEGRIALTPVLSRCRNIGRLNGTHENEETYRAQLGLRHSDGSYRGGFNMVNRVSEEQSRRLARWMIPEVPRYFAEREQARRRPET